MCTQFEYVHVYYTLGFDSIESLSNGCMFFTTHMQFFPCEFDIDLKDSLDSFWGKFETQSDLFQVSIINYISTSVMLY